MMATLIRMLAGETAIATVSGTTPIKLARLVTKAPWSKVSTVPCATTANLIKVCRLAPGASGGGARIGSGEGDGTGTGDGEGDGSWEGNGDESGDGEGDVQLA